MPTITIEWRHLEVAGQTCQRCGDTGQELARAIAHLREECGPRGVTILFSETRLPLEQVNQSNTILINGAPLETLLPQATAAASCCDSCGDLTGRPEQCRTIVHLGQVHETIPQVLIRQAVCRIGDCC